MRGSEKLEKESDTRNRGGGFIGKVSKLRRQSGVDRSWGS